MLIYRRLENWHDPHGTGSIDFHSFRETAREDNFVQSSFVLTLVFFESWLNHISTARGIKTMIFRKFGRVTQFPWVFIRGRRANAADEQVESHDKIGQSTGDRNCASGRIQNVIL